MATFKPDPNLEKNLQKMARDAAQKAFDAAHKKAAGKEQAQTRRVLAEEAKKAGLTLPAKNLDEISAAIARGEKPKAT